MSQAVFFEGSSIKARLKIQVHCGQVLVQVGQHKHLCPPIEARELARCLNLLATAAEAETAAPEGEVSATGLVDSRSAYGLLQVFKSAGVSDREIAAGSGVSEAFLRKVRTRTTKRTQVAKYDRLVQLFNRLMRTDSAFNRRVRALMKDRQ